MSMSSSMKVEMVYQNNQQSLAKVRQELERIFTVGQQALEEAGAPRIDTKSYNEAIQAARQLHDILNRSFDNDLGVTNIAKFRAELEKSGLNLQTVYRDLSKIGPEGQQAFRDMAASIATSNIQLQKTTGFFDKMATTFMNTIRWSFATTVLNGVTDSLSNAVNYVEKLDTSLNNIRIVTGKSAEDMGTFAKEANKAAQALGASTRDIAEGALIFYQQGDTDADAMYKAQVTQKLTNVSTDLDADEASEFMTAIWNGFQVNKRAAQEGMQVYDEYADKLAAVAASTASNVTEQATAMAKVASAANTVGVSFDQLNAIMATTESVTRQAPETIGTAWRTIFSRMTDLKLGNADEEGVTLGDVSGKLSGYGINILDETGDLRELGEVIDEVGEKWNQWTTAQQVAVAELIAGKRQYNNVIALFSEWNDMYQEALATSETGVGKLQEMQDIYMESNAAIRQQFKTAGEELYSDMFDVDTVNDFYKVMTKVINLVDGLVKSLGGAVPIFTAIGGFFTQIISNKLAVGLGDIMNRWQSSKLQLENAKEALQLVKEVQKISNIDKETSEILNYIDKFTTKQQFMNDEQKQILRNLVEQRQEVQKLQSDWNILANKISKATGLTKEEIIKGGDSFLNKKDELSKIRSNLSAISSNIVPRSKNLIEGQTFGDFVYDLQAELDSLSKTNKFTDIYTELKAKNANDEQIFLAFRTELNKQNKELGTTITQLDLANKQYSDIAIKSSAASEGMQNLAGQMENAIKIQPVIDIIGAFGGLSSSLMTVSNSFNVLTNSASSSEEKLYSLQGLLMTFPFLFKNLEKILKQTSFNTFFNDKEFNKNLKNITDTAKKNAEDAEKKAQEARRKAQALREEANRTNVAAEEANEVAQKASVKAKKKRDIAHNKQLEADYVEGINKDYGYLRADEVIEKEQLEITSAERMKDVKTKQANAKRANTVATKAESEAIEANTLAEQMNQIASETSANADKAEANAKELEVAATEKSTIAKEAEEAQEKKSISTKALLTKGILGTVEIVGLLAAALLLVVNSIQQARYEAAKTNANNLSNNLEEYKNQLDELKNSIQEAADEQRELRKLEENSGLTQAEKERLDYLDKQLPILQEQRKNLESLIQYTEELNKQAQIATLETKSGIDIINSAMNILKGLGSEIAIAFWEAVKPIAILKDLLEGTDSSNFLQVSAWQADARRMQQNAVMQLQLSDDISDEERLMIFEQRYQEVQNEIKKYQEQLGKEVNQNRRQILEAEIQAAQQDLTSLVPQINTIIQEEEKALESLLNGKTIDQITDSQLKAQILERQSLINAAHQILGLNVDGKDLKQTADDVIKTVENFWNDLSKTTQEEIKQLYKEDKFDLSYIDKNYSETLKKLGISSQDALTILIRTFEQGNEAFDNVDEKISKTCVAMQGLNNEVKELSFDDFAEFFNIPNTEKDPFKGLIGSVEEYSHILKKLKGDISAVGEALKEQSKNGKISADTALNLIEKNELFAGALETTDDGIKVNSESLKTLMIREVEAAKAAAQRTLDLYDEADKDLKAANAKLEHAKAAKLVNAQYRKDKDVVKQFLKGSEYKNLFFIDDLWGTSYNDYKKKIEDINRKNQQQAFKAGIKWTKNNVLPIATNAQFTAAQNAIHQFIAGGVEQDISYAEAQQKAIQETLDSYDPTQIERLRKEVAGYDAIITSILNGTAFTDSSGSDKKHTKQIAEKYRNLLGEDIDVIQNEIKNYEDKLKRIQEQIADAIKNGDYELAQKLSGDYDTLANAAKQRKAELAKRYRAVLSEMYADILEDLRKNGVPIPEEITDLESFFIYLPKLQGNIEQHYNQMEQRLEAEIAEMKSADKVDNNAIEAKERELNNIKLAREAATSNISNAKELYDLVGTKEGEGSFAEQYKKEVEQQQKNWQDAYQTFKNNIKETIDDIDYEITELNNEMSSLEPTQYTEKFALQNKILELNKQKLAEVAKYQQWLDENRDAVGLKYYNEQTRANNKELQSLNKTLQDNVKALKDQAKAMRDAAISLEDSVAQAWDKEMQNQFDATEKQIDAEERLLKKRKQAIDEAKKALDKYLKALEDSWKTEDAHEERKKKLEERAEKAGERATQLTAAASGDLAALAQIRDLDKELKSMDEELQQDIIEDIRDSFKKYIEDIETNWDEALEKEQKIIDNQKEALEDEKRNWTEKMRTPEFWADVIRVAQGGTANVNGTQMSYADMIASGYQWEGKGGTEEAYKGINEAVRTQGSVIEGWYNNPDKDTLEYYISTPLAQLRESIDALNTTLGGKTPLATSTLGTGIPAIYKTAANIAGQATSGTMTEGVIKKEPTITGDTVNSPLSADMLTYDFAEVFGVLSSKQLAETEKQTAAIEKLSNDLLNAPMSINFDNIINIEGDVGEKNLGTIRTALDSNTMLKAMSMELKRGMAAQGAIASNRK